MDELYRKILEPKIVEDEFEGKHAIIHMPNMRTMLKCIYQNEIFWEDAGEEGSSREKWTYGSEIVGRENLHRALTIGQTSNKVIRLYQKLRSEMDMDARISKFVGKGLSCKRKRVVRDDGDDLSMSRLMGGQDQYWSTTVRKSQRSNVRIGMNMAISWKHKEKDFARLGATLALISDVLTKMGFAVEVLAYNFTRYNGSNPWKHFGISIPIKMPNEPLDIHRLMSAGLSGLFRDYCFGLMDKEYGFYGNMGRQCETTDTYKRELNLLHVVEQRFCKTTDQAIDGLAQTLQKLADKPKWFRG
tara:strand:- start:169 stop:1071 length:903 start_codon:yes stop_codon:yes gene_type:complete